MTWGVDVRSDKRFARTPSPKKQQMPLTFASQALKQTDEASFTPLLKWEQLRINKAFIVYEPGVFGGDGSESRVNICIKNDAVGKNLGNRTAKLEPAGVLVCQEGRRRLHKSED